MQKEASFEGFAFHKAPPVTNVRGMFSETLAFYCMGSSAQPMGRITPVCYFIPL